MTDARDETSDVVVPERGEGRRQRVGDSGSPVGSTLSIILAVVAVIAGFLILRALTSDDDSSSEEGNTITPVQTAATTPGTGTSDSGTAGSDVGSSTTTPMAETKTGATIVVANASGVPGSALQMSTALTTDGYMTVGEPGNSTGDPIPASVVYFAANDPAAQAVAMTLAADLGGVETAPIPDPRPAEAGAVAEATVLVMLGQDAAGRTLAELTAGGGVAGETTVPGGGVVPPPEIVTSSSGG